MAEQLRQGTFTPLEHDRVLAIAIADALSAGICAMCPVPDDDPRWRAGLQDPYSPDLGELFVQPYLMHVLASDPDNDTVRWLAITIDLYLGDNDFAAGLIEPLVERDVAAVRWLVAGARWVRDLSGVDTSETLRSSLSRLSSRIGGFSAKLGVLERSGERAILAASVAEVIDEPS